MFLRSDEHLEPLWRAYLCVIFAIIVAMSAHAAFGLWWRTTSPPPFPATLEANR